MIVSIIGNQAPFKGNLIEVSEENTIFLEKVLIDYDKSGSGNFIFLNKSNILKAVDLLVRNIYGLETFIFCGDFNTIWLINSTVVNNEWTHCFFLSQSSNSVSFKNIKILNISITESASGFIYLRNLTSLSLSNLEFQYLSGKSSMIIKSDLNNVINIEDMKVVDIRVIDGGACLTLIDSNKIYLSRVKFGNFQGFSNDLFIMLVNSTNFLYFNEITIEGSFTLEQFWNLTCVIRISGNRNLINITNSVIYSVNPSLLKVESLYFIYLEGKGNILAISNTTKTFINYLSFLCSKAESLILLQDCRFKNSNLYGHMIILRSKTSFTCIKTKFHHNVLRKEKCFLLLSANVVALLKTISCNTNNLFIKSEKAIYNLSHSQFIFQVVFEENFSSALFINDQGSKAFYDFVEILQRENKEDSIIIICSSVVHIRYSTFGFNRGMMGGVLRLSNQSELFLYSNKFIANEALNGGVLKFENTSVVSIISNYFYSNRAVNRFNKTRSFGKGGCFYASVDPEQNLNRIEVRGNRFILGGAEIGGIFYLHEKRSADYFLAMGFLQLNRFDRIKMRYYGRFFASHPYEMKLVAGIDLNSEGTFSLKLDSKMPFSTPLNKCLFQIISTDVFNQTAIGEYGFEELTINHDDSQLSFEFVIHNSFLCFSSVKPTLSTNLENLTDHPLLLDFNNSQLTSFQFTNRKLEAQLSIRKCKRGEYLDIKQLECLSCQPNFYSFDDDFVYPSSCKTCQTERFYCYGGFNHTPKPGYWRRSSESINFIKCPYPKACLGDTQLLDDFYQISIFSEIYSSALEIGQCAMAYEGILCSICQEGYAKIGGMQCAPCSEGLSIFLMLLKIVLRILLYYYTIFKAVIMGKHVENNDLASDLVYSNFLLKILILHFQFLKSFLGFPLSFPNMLNEVFNIFSFSISSGADKVLNLECLINVSFIPVSYIYCMINLLAPLVVVSTIKLFLPEEHRPEILGSARKTIKNRRKSVFVEKLKSAIYLKSVLKKRNPTFTMELSKKKLEGLPYLFMISLMLSYDEILGLLVQNFSFINVDDERNPEFRVVNAFEIDFYSYQHQIWIYSFSLPATILIGLILPSFIIYKIYRAKKEGQLAKKLTLGRYGYFFFAFDYNQYTYETVYILRKIFLIAMDNFFIKVLSLSNIYNPQSICIILCFFYTGLSIFTRLNAPYNKTLYPALNRMENMSVSAQAITSWIGCLLISFDEENNEGLKDKIYMIGFLVAILINGFVFIGWGYNYWKLSVLNRFKTAINIIEKSIFKKSKGLISKKAFQIEELKQSSLSQLEVWDINKETEQQIYIPPHSSSSWSKFASNKCTGTWNDTFFAIFSPDINPILGLSWIDYLWNNQGNTQKSGNNNNNDAFGNLQFSKWKIEGFSNVSKSLACKVNQSATLEISFQLQIRGPLNEDDEQKFISKVYSANFAIFLSSIHYEFEAMSKTVLFKFRAQVNKLIDLRLVNKLKMTMIYEGHELLCCQFNVLLFDFLERNMEPLSSDEEGAFHQLLMQGVQYSSESRIITLTFSPENLKIQVIKTKKLRARDQKLGDAYYLRIVSASKNNWQKYLFTSLQSNQDL